MEAGCRHKEFYHQSSTDYGSVKRELSDELLVVRFLPPQVECVDRRDEVDIQVRSVMLRPDHPDSYLLDTHVSPFVNLQPRMNTDFV